MRAIADEEALRALHRPVAVFDAGIGSYAAVALIQRMLPRQDIVYFADRASFPYGDKSRSELLGILHRTLHFLDGFSPTAVLVASNAPSVTVLDDLAGVIAPSVLGVRPPIRRALALAGGHDVAVLGVRSLVRSPELRLYADAEAQGRGAQVHLVDASALVALVEGGDFLFEAEKTQSAVDAFVQDLDAQYPKVGALTLSSTHLPWLRSYLDTTCGQRPLLDPLEDAVTAIMPYAVPGTGKFLGLVTEDERYSIEDFRRMLSRLGVSVPLHTVLA